MNYVEIASTVIPIVSAVGGAYLKLRDQMTELKAENKSAMEVRARMEHDINTIQRDIHNLALIIGTKRALSEEKTKGE